MARKALIALSVTLMMLFAVTAFCGTTGIISGIVTDSATGDRLAGVNVIVESINLTTVTDEKGYYVITNVPPGDYDVTASLVGYSDGLANVSVIMDVTTPLDFALEQAVAQEEEVVVVESRPMVRHDVVPTMYIVENTQEQMIKGQPNIMYAAPGIVTTQPGIIADESGYPHIRGGRENQIGWFIDGIPITEPILNAFGTNLITVGMDKMEIYTGGYRAEYGNAISGVFNQVVKTGRIAPGSTLSMLAGADSFKGTYPEIGGVTENGLDYYVGAYLWHSALEGMASNEVDSSDMIGKFSYPVGKKDTLSLLLANGSELYKYPGTHDLTYDGSVEVSDLARDESHQSHTLAALTLNHQINANSFFTLRPYYFRSRKQIDAAKVDYAYYIPGQPYWWEDSESASKGILLDYTNQVNEKHLIKAGYMRIASDNRFWARVPLQDDPDMGRYEYYANTDTAQSGLYIQDQMRLSPKWRAEIGIRYDRMSYDREIFSDFAESQWSPRLGLSYVVNPKTNLRFSYGKMIQFVHTRAIERNYADPTSGWAALYYGDGTGRMYPERNTQYDLGWERQVSDNYSIQATVFQRKFSDLLQTVATPPLGNMVYVNAGNGTSKGLELLLKRKPSKNWSGWFSYTLSSAKAQANSSADPTSAVERYVNWDQRHTAVLVVNYENAGWIYSLAGEYGSGLPYGETNEMRVSSHKAFNLNIAKEIKGGILPQGTLQLSIANLFNTGAVLDREPIYDPISYEITGWESSARVAPRFVSLSYTRNF